MTGLARYRRIDAPTGDAPDLASAVRAGLAAPPYSVPPRFFYDDVGAALFDAITALPEYDLTRNETAILERAAAEILDAAGRPPRTVELGAGYGTKTRLLLAAQLAHGPATYVPIDIHPASLDTAAAALLGHFGEPLSVDGVCGEYDAALAALPDHDAALWLWLGSSIGNLAPARATAFLSRVRARMQPDDRLLIGFDRVKDAAELEAAYDDAAGVTARFNQNLLVRINAELDADFDLDDFAHHALYDPPERRVEMHLIARRPVRARVQALGLDVTLDTGEGIHTECAYKYTPSRADAICARAGLATTHRWTERDRFDLVLLRPA